MAVPEVMPTTPDLYYDWLITKLQSNANYEGDGFYIYDTLRGGEHEDLPDAEIDFRIGDYACHFLQTVDWKCTPALHRTQLEHWRTSIAVHSFTRRANTGYELPVEFAYEVFQPAQVDMNSVFEVVTRRAIEALGHDPAPDEVVVYSNRDRDIVQQPLENPYLRAVYRHLNR